MVTQHGSTTLAIPSHDDTLATSGAHTVAMVSADGTQTQPVRPGRLLGVLPLLSFLSVRQALKSAG